MKYRYNFYKGQITFIYLLGALEMITKFARAVIGSGTLAGLVATLLVATPMESHAGSGNTLVSDSFASEGSRSNWIFAGATRDGADDTPKIVDGALLLTPNEKSQAGFALYNLPQPSSSGLDIAFTISHWAPEPDPMTTGADGITFFLKRGDDTSTSLGSGGGWLGYGNLSGALLGVGFDLEGGFVKRNTTGCSGFPEGSENRANNLAIRGPALSSGGGYCLLKTDAVVYLWQNRPTAEGVLDKSSGRKIRVKYDPPQGGTAGTVKVWVDDVSGTPKLEVTAPDELVDSGTFKFGFTAGTGNRTNNHSVWDVVVQTVNQVPAPEIETTSLPPFTASEAYETPVKATGGINPLTYSISAGNLPPGLSLSSSTGMLSGTPTTAGTYTFDVTVADNRDTPATDTQSFTVVVSPRLIPSSEGRDFFVTFDANLLGYERRVRINDSQGIPHFAEQWLYVSGEPGTEFQLHLPPIDPVTGIGRLSNYTIGDSGVKAINASDELVQKVLGSTTSTANSTSVRNLDSITQSFVNGLPATTWDDLPKAGASASDDVASNALRVQVVTPGKRVAVYGANLQRNTSDAFSAIPTHALGTRYRAVAWDHFVFSPAGERPSRISVIATQPGTTTLTITPPAGHTGLHKKGDADHPRTALYTVELQRGEVYSVTSETKATGTQKDVSGTLIEADKKVVVASGNECAKVGTGGSCDHLVQYLPPASSWGTSYILASSINSGLKDFYRIVADTNGTTLELNGSPIKDNSDNSVILQAGQFVDIQASAVEAFDVLETNHPVLVGKFISGRDPNKDFWGFTGDPSMTVVTPTLQFLDSYTVATPSSGFSVHSINVVIPTADINSLVFTDLRSNDPITRTVADPGPEGSTGLIPGSDYSFVRFDVPAGAYQISATQGIGVYVEGFKNFDSYSYVGGMAFVDLVENPEGALAVQREQEAQQTTPPPSSPPPTPQQRPPRQPVNVAPAPPPTNQVLRLPEIFGPVGPVTTPPLVAGPITRGQALVPPNVPLATVNGTPQTVNTEQIGSSGVRVSTGNVNVGVTLSSETTGRIVQNQAGAPELAIARGQTTLISGAGLLPQSTVQVFMAFGNQSAELARIEVDATGTFNGQAALQTPGSNAPLPIGRHLLQVVTVDQEGNQTVVDMPINVAQPSPQPEIILSSGETPALSPGQSLATRAGEPISINLIPIPDNKQTLIDGGDWSMSIIARGDGSKVAESSTGEVLIEFIRDETVDISGSGFMPLTRADVWLFSEPTLLGTVDIDENGEFNGSINVDGRVVTVGQHTLQLQGVGEDGYVRSANLGVIVKDPDSAIPSTEQASLAWIWWLAALLAIALAFVVWLRRRKQEKEV